MEGPSLHLAAEQLQPFAGRHIERVAGNSTIGIERLAGLKVKEIFCVGKAPRFSVRHVRAACAFHALGHVCRDRQGTLGDRAITGEAVRRAWSSTFRTAKSRSGQRPSSSWRSGTQGRAYDFAADVMADEWDARAALAKVQGISARRDRRRPARPGHLRGRRQHHQERSAVQNARQPVRQSARHIGPQAEGDRRRCANVLVPISRAAAGFLAAQEPRGVPAERLPAMRRQNRAPCARPARAAQLLLREMSKRACQRIFQNADTTLRIRYEYSYRPSTRCSRPDTSSTAARASVNRRVNPASE